MTARAHDAQPIVTYRLDDAMIAHISMRDIPGNNALSAPLVDALLEACDQATEQKASALILSGTSEVFSAGAERASLEAIASGEFHVRDLIVSERLINMPMPVIAAIEGHAIGGGLVMAACCDIVVGALESRYGAVFINMGFTPGMGCTTLLELLVGAPLAHEMMYTGRRFRGRELATLGVHFNRLLPKDRVLPTALDIARQIAEKNPTSIALLKYALGARKKRLLTTARLQEDLMHRITFNLPETARTIQEFYHDSE